MFRTGGCAYFYSICSPFLTAACDSISPIPVINGAGMYFCPIVVFISFLSPQLMADGTNFFTSDPPNPANMLNIYYNATFFKHNKSS